MTPSFFLPQLTVAFLLDGRTVNTMRTFGLCGLGAAAGAAAPGAGAPPSSATATIATETRINAAPNTASPARLDHAALRAINHHLRLMTRHRRRRPPSPRP